MNNAPIGILDSGFGGLTIYRNIVQLLPHESTIYIGDHAHIPYSEKTPTYIHTRVKKLIQFFISKHIKLVVIACNTATVAGIDIYRKAFPDVPIIGVVPVVKTAAEKTRKKSFAILSTNFTANSAYQKNLIRTFTSECRVYNLGVHSLVDSVEKGIVEGKGIKKELSNILTPEILKHIDVIALGCTHYPFLEKTIRSIVGKRVEILDSGGAVARQSARILSHNALESATTGATHIFYSTKNDEKLSLVASKLLGVKIKVGYAHI